ncbi:MAG: hypothetical protein HY730_05495 [Candidatus Tectomicrobia bacterium]|uniref:Uncharacterized protein n=1 Tax=Tectimicrobiota bacterium TaxID=2528274 RepID=A0A933GN48_UNCTE|nr:hypothetical protein [Candidatus Tectomicrobia bacterium]
MTETNDMQPKDGRGAAPINRESSTSRELCKALLNGPFPHLRKIDSAALAMKMDFLMPLITVFTGCCCEDLEKGKFDEAHQSLERNARNFAEALNIPLVESRLICLCLLVYDLRIKSFFPLFKLMDMTMDEEVRRQFYQNIWETMDSRVQNVP